MVVAWEHCKEQERNQVSPSGDRVVGNSDPAEKLVVIGGGSHKVVPCLVVTA